MEPGLSRASRPPKANAWKNPGVDALRIRLGMDAPETFTHCVLVQARDRCAAPRRAVHTSLPATRQARDRKHRRSLDALGCLRYPFLPVYRETKRKKNTSKLFRLHMSSCLFLLDRLQGSQSRVARVVTASCCSDLGLTSDVFCYPPARLYK